MGRRIVTQSRPWVPFGQNLIRVINEPASIADRVILRLLSGHVIYAASPALLDVQIAIASASAGDTVIVPAGAAAWASVLSITKAINLIGAGIGNTVISGSGINYNPTVKNSSQRFRFSGFTMNMTGGFCSLSNSTVTPIYVRIDNNRVVCGPSHVFSVTGTVFGCIDNNYLQNARGSSQYVASIYGLNETTWANLVFTLGTGENLFFEDNYFYCGDVFFGTGAGARFCVRHNTGSSGYLWPYVDLHGNQRTGSDNHAGQGVEVYENVLSGTPSGCFFDQRGGRGVCWGNVLANSMVIRCREESGWASGGYDCWHPTGAPEPYGARGFGIDGEPQHVSDSYYWENRTSGGALIQPEIEDTLNYDSPQSPAGNGWSGPWPYTGLGIGVVPRWDATCFKQVTSFNGSTGMGVGPRSARPASCALEGAGYWATDERILYRWHIGTWQAFYAPYTYPHPFRASS